VPCGLIVVTVHTVRVTVLTPRAQVSTRNEFKPREQRPHGAFQHGVLMASVWHPYGISMASLWHPYGVLMASVWHPYGVRMASVWRPYGVLMASIWRPYGIHMVSLWHPYGILVVSVWRHGVLMASLLYASTAQWPHVCLSPRFPNIASVTAKRR